MSRRTKSDVTLWSVGSTHIDVAWKWPVRQTREKAVRSVLTALRLMEKYPYRIQKVKWSDSPGTSSFQVTLKIVAAHEASVINEIFDTVNSFKASVRNFNVSDNDRNGTYDIQVKLSVPNNLELDKVISQIRVKKNIIKVSRL